ncbi:MAG: DinB family protein [Bacteroidetes bacterium]|nr:DinB family protein [Bacteroidota bacterium]
MIRTIDDFLKIWHEEKAATLKVFGNLTDASLSQAWPGGRSIGRLANHITDTLSELPAQAGLPLTALGKDYGTVQELINAYDDSADRVAEVVSEQWHDGMLDDEVPMYGQSWKRGFCLWALIAHQAHHRGQMTVLMRFAGLKVPGVYGPSKEEWAAYNMAPQE